jgi:hypothetical protein
MAAEGYSMYETWEDLHHGAFRDAMRSVVEVRDDDADRSTRAGATSSRVSPLVIKRPACG